MIRRPPKSPLFPSPPLFRSATGAADAYARMTGRPAAVLLHLGPGLSNGLANLHNARRSRAPVVLVVGDHARSHKRLDAPLESEDRKSTRLNSSHANISYAVF